MSGPRSAACLLALAACGTPPDGKELAAIRAELADIRVEVRSLREELHGQRAGGDASAPGAPPTSPATPREPAAAVAGTAGSPATPPEPGVSAAASASSAATVDVDSTPSGADVFVADEKVGVTPLVVRFPEGGGELHVRVQKAGYRPHLMNLRPGETGKVSIQLARKSR